VDDTARLRDLARRLADVYDGHTRPRAVLLTGSAATGGADQYSDIDLILYYDELPTTRALDRAREAAGGAAPRLLWPPDEGNHIEAFDLEGVQCQLAHTTIAAWEGELDQVLVDLDVESPLQKALEGLLDGLPLRGEETIAEWRARAEDYPVALQRAMIERHWRFFPIWAVHEHVATRDAALWRRRILVDSVYDLLAVLAGLNRVYFTSFQLKRTGKLVARLELAPRDLGRRIEELFALDDAAAAAELEALVTETHVLVAGHLPDLGLEVPRPTGQVRSPE
jgi:hypothetical protein